MRYHKLSDLGAWGLVFCAARVYHATMSDQSIQFISAEELRAEAIARREEQDRNSLHGLTAQFDQALEELGGPEFVKKYAIEDPGGFLKLLARMKMGAKQAPAATKIYIGLPRTELDGPEEPETP